MPALLDDCERQQLSPLRSVVDLLVCVLVGGSFIPKINRIIDNSSSEGISGSHMLLVIISVNAHLAARIGGRLTKASHDCIRSGHLQGWKAFSAFIMVLQILVHWVTTIILLAVYVTFRKHHNDQHGKPEYLAVRASDPGIPSNQLGFEPVDIHSQSQRILALASGHPSRLNMDSASNTTPSNTAILAVSIMHAFVVFPPAFFILFNKRNLFGTYAFGFFQQRFYIILSLTGLATSFVSIVLQAYLMLSRYHSGLGLGSFSVLGSGLQFLALGALCVSQSVRLWFWPFDDTPLWGLLTWFLDTGGPAVSYGVLTLGQGVIFCVALWVDSKRREDLLIM